MLGVKVATKLDTTVKVLLAVTVVVASAMLIGAFGSVAANAIASLAGSPTLKVAVSADTPRPQQITAPATNVDLFHVQFALSGRLPQAVITRLTFNVQTNLADGRITNARLYDGNDRLIAGPVAVNNYHDTITFDGRFVLSSLPLKVKVKADLAGDPGQSRQVRLALDPQRGITLGPTVALVKILPAQVLRGNALTVVGPAEQFGQLTVTLDSTSPTGRVVQGSAQNVLTLRLAATSASDITIKDIEVMMDGNAAITGQSKAVWRDTNGTVYATFPANAGMPWFLHGNHWSVMQNDGDRQWDTPLVIPAGQSKQLMLVGDTTGARSEQVLLAKVRSAGATVSGVVWQDAFGHTVDAATTQYLPINGNALVF